MQQAKDIKDKKFYFLLDYKKTKAAIKTKIDQFNADQKLLFESNPDDFRKKNKLYGAQTYKSCTLKSSEETTMWMILEMFGGYLQGNANMNHIPDEFRINNQAICTKKSNRIVSSTVFRHIRKLLAAGVISEKIFRGSNTSYDLKLNPDLIYFRPNSEYNFMLMELYKPVFSGVEVNPRVFKGILSFSATLRNFPFGFTLANRTDISTSIIILEHKINMESGIVNFDFPSPSALPSENQVNNDFLEKNEFFYLNTESQKACQTENTPPIAAAPPAGELEADPLGLEKDKLMQLQVGYFVNNAENQKKSNVHPKSEQEKLWKHVLSFYAYVTAILWPERVITTYERNLICSSIYKHFKKELGDQPVEPGVFMFRGAFMFRALLTLKYLKKNPLWTMESPISYFDFDNKKGFNGTAGWVEKTKEMEAKNKMYLEHYKIFIQAWKDYTKDPNMQSYRAAAQRLGKLKNTCWIEFFNQGVANHNAIETQGPQQIWRNNYQA